MLAACPDRGVSLDCKLQTLTLSAKYKRLLGDEQEEVPFPLRTLVSLFESR